MSSEAPWNASALVGTHLIGSTAAPSIAAGAGAGSSTGLAVSVVGTDLSGQISFSTGSTTPTASAAVCTLTFANAFDSAPAVVLSPANALASALSGAAQVFASASATALTVTAGATHVPASTGPYLYNYLVAQ